MLSPYLFQCRLIVGKDRESEAAAVDCDNPPALAACTLAVVPVATGLPNFLPSFLALAKPSIVRSLIRFRSNSAKALNICNINLPSELLKSATGRSRQTSLTPAANKLCLGLKPRKLKKRRGSLSLRFWHYSDRWHCLFDDMTIIDWASYSSFSPTGRN